MVLDHIAEVKCDDVQDSKIFIGPTKSSIFIRDCNNCEFTIACKQLRTRNCHNCKIHLFAGTDPIVETSTNIVISRFNGAYPKIEEHFKKVGLDPLQNHWRRVFDFTPSTTDKPNWSLSDEYTLWSIEEAKNSVPLTSGDDIKDPVDGTVDGMQSFSFNTSQAEAQKMLKKTQESVPSPPAVPTASTGTTAPTTTTATTSAAPTTAATTTSAAQTTSATTSTPPTTAATTSTTTTVPAPPAPTTA